MPMPWLLLFSLVLGSRPWVFSLEKKVESKDEARCSQGLSCQFMEVLCLLESAEPTKEPVLVPTKLQTEVVLRCREESDCVPCVRVTTLNLTVQEPRKEDRDETGLQEDTELTSHPWPRNESLQAKVILSFQAYLTDRCIWVMVEVPAAMVQPGQNVGSVVFDCFEAPVGGEVQILSYTQSPNQKKLNHTLQLPDCFRPEMQDSVQSCWVLPSFNISTEGDTIQMVLDASIKQNYVLSVYWDQTRDSRIDRFHGVLTGPQNITLNQTDLVPCLCIQVHSNVSDSLRNTYCPFREDSRAQQNLWSHSKLKFLRTTSLSWQVEAPCPLSAETVLCWKLMDSETCHPLPVPKLLQNVTVNKFQDLPLKTLHPNVCVQVWSRGKLHIQECPLEDILDPLRDDILVLETWGPQETQSFCAMETSGCTLLPSMAHTRAALLGKQLLQDLQSGQCMQLWNDTGVLWVCSLQKYVHKRWVLAWLGFLVLAACILLLLLANRGGVKGAARGRRALLLYCPDHAGFERLVGTLATALAQLRLPVALDLWHRRELSALGPLAWFHAQRRRALQEGGLLVLLFSPGAAALCAQWLRAEAPAGTGPFAASLSCVLPDFLEGRAPGRYLVACFEELLPARDVPELFRAVPVFSLPSQMPAFLRALAGPGTRRREAFGAQAPRVAQSLRPALDECLRRGATSRL
ncbi:interleukin-17 receptor C isoform X2 [Macrotis lagotis]|uniref:interleukin-17 receptor C isoform X2 n=1 Tax=Macrotis lagotis TaxID=92651 RepID=UPI003D695EA7